MEHPELSRRSEDWLVEATVEQMQAEMEAGRITSKGLVLMYLARIAKYDKKGPEINAVLEINPEALHIAEALDSERARKGPRGPWHGIPVLLKDNIETGDKMHTSAGSIALADHYASEDSQVARKLREAGAVLLGKTNMTEWANFMSYDMPSGYSSRGGQVKNAYGGKDPGGSSSGSGAAVAWNLAAAAIGTETSGSIISPASDASIVGIKPTVGLISRRGIIPLAHSQDTAGPMARTVRDAASLLGLLTGVDERDPITVTSEGKALQNYLPYCDPNGLQGARLGYDARCLKPLDEEGRAVFERELDVLRAQGATVVEVEVPHLGAEGWGYRVLWFEFKADLNAFLSTVGPQVPVRSLKELIQYHEAHADKALKYGQQILVEAEETSGTLTDPEYIAALEKDIHLSREAGLDALFAAERLDALVSASNYGVAIPAKAGYPSITVPAGYVGKEPVGLTFSGLAYSEAALIRLAYGYEQATKHRVPPQA